MSFADTQAALGVAIATKRTPVLLWGAPGQGKTQTLYAIAKANDMHIENVLASIREPSDFAGLPYVVDGKTTLIAPDWAQRIASHTADGGSAMLFFDEISTAPPASQAALLRVALERTAGDLYLGDNVAIVAAANPPELAADGWDLAAPMANRFCHLDFALTAEAVREGFSFGWGDVIVPTVDRQKAEEEVSNAMLLVAAFLTSRPDLVTVMPNSSAEAGRAYPTPRSWEMAATLYGYATAAGVTGVARRMLVTGSIGQGAGAEFLAYVADLDLPNPEDLLADPASFVAPTRGDRVYAIGASVLAALKSNNTPARWIATGQVISAIVKANHADVAVALGKKWISEDMRLGPEWIPDAESLRTFAPILKEMNLLPKK